MMKFDAGSASLKQAEHGIPFHLIFKGLQFPIGILLP